MSLFKQISLIMSLFLLFVLTAVISFNFQSAKTYAQEEMSNNAQNTATFLSLSLSGANGNVSQMGTTINAIFDSGYFQKIILVDTEGRSLYQRIKEETVQQVPSWFLSIYDVKAPLASATVSSGWRPIGSIIVEPVEESAQIKLYNNFLEILKSFALIALVTFVLLYLLLKFSLSSLNRVREQAEAVSDNNFIINESIPSTSEFKEVTLAMNKMVTKVKEIFEKEAISAQDYHKLLYTDTLTGLHNRSFFELKLNDFLSSQEADSNGIVLTLFLEGVADANKSIGHEKVNQLIQELSTASSKESKVISGAIVSRIDGTKICFVFPRAQSEEIEDIANRILTQSLMHLETIAHHECECSIKLIQFKYSSQDTVASVLNNIEHNLLKADKNCITDFSEEENSNYHLQRSLIEERIKEHSIAIALQDVYDTNSDIMHSEAYVRLFDEHKNVHEAGDFIPQVHKMQLDTKLDQNVINAVVKESSLEDRDIAINISVRFLQDEEALRWLKERLAGLNKERVLCFELSNHNLLSALNEGLAFSSMLREIGHCFGIDRFSIEEGTNLNYLQMLKPQYLKIDASYLHGMLQGGHGQINHALKILIESLDIKIIATNIENRQTKEALESMGIQYFQGSYLGEPKLI